MFTLQFIYKENEYTALVHEKYHLNQKEYRVTIMDGELERLLYGDHVFVEEDGSIQDPKTTMVEKLNLLMQVTNALKAYLQQIKIY